MYCSNNLMFSCILNNILKYFHYYKATKISKLESNSSSTICGGRIAVDAATLYTLNPQLLRFKRYATTATCLLKCVIGIFYFNNCIKQHEKGTLNETPFII